MSKKTKAKSAYFLLMFGCVFGILCAIFTLPTFLCIADAILVGIATHLFLLASYCPHCGKYSVKIKPFSKESPSCKICGKEQP
jgi:hypothetical protein